MGVIRLRHSAGINSARINRSLKFADRILYLSQLGIDNGRNLAQYYKPVTEIGISARTVSQGVVCAQPSTTQFVGFDPVSSGGKFLPSGPFTVLAFGVLLGGGGQQDYIIGTDYNFGGNNREAFTFRANTWSLEATTYQSGVTGGASVSCSADYGKLALMYCVVGSDSATETWEVGYFVNKKKISASSSVAANSRASENWRIGAAADLSSGGGGVVWRPYTKPLAYVCIVDGRLNESEINALGEYPWSIFEPDGFYLPIQTGGGAPTTTVTVDAGSLVLTGQPVTDTVTATVGAGTVTLIGQNVALQQQQPVTAGTTSLTGQSIGITITVPIDPGTLSLTGSDVTVVPPSGSFSIAVDPGALSLTGQAVTNLVTTPISEGSTSLTGQDVSVTTTVTVDPGSITLTGEVITVSYLGTQTIPIEPGTLSVTGRDVEVSITGGTKGGVGKGKNLTLKQKKKLKAVVSQEWLKAEQTAKELLQERLGNVEPAKVRVERLTTVQSLADVIAALQALSKETVTLPEQQAVIKSFEKSIDTKVIKTGERLVAVEDKVNETLGRIEKKIQNLEDLLIVVIDELL